MKFIAVILTLLFVSTGGVAQPFQEAEALREANDFDAIEALVADHVDGEGEQAAEANYWMSRVTMSRGQFDEAVDYVETAIDMNPGQSRYQVAAGNAYGRSAQEASFFKQMGLAKKSKKAYEKAVELDPGSIPARRGLIGYLSNAPGIAGGDMDEARAQARAIGEIDQIEGLLSLAGIELADDEPKQAMAYYQQILEIDPEHINARFNLAMASAAEEDYDTAFAGLDDVIERDPKHLQANYQYGRLASISGLNLEQGIERFDRFLELGRDQSPNWRAWANYRAGMIYERLDQPEVALARYRTAYQIDPEHEEAEEAIKRLN